MSSASIMSAIHHKESEITACQNRIFNLENKLEEQKNAYKKYCIMSDEFAAALDRKRRKKEAVTELSSVNKLAEKFSEQIETVFNSSSSNQQKIKMLDISASMQQEISNTESLLANEHQELKRLRDELERLKVEYRNELLREQEAASLNKKV